MNENEMTVEERFYQDCAKLLRVEHVYAKFPYSKRTRWNNRTAGNGRYAGRGSVRLFGENAIQIMLHTPKCVKTCKSMQEALDVIKNAMVQYDLLHS
jgi:hypothetical protein